MGESMYGPGVHVSFHEAMSSPFEIHIVGEEALYARQASQAAFREIDRLEMYLSHFQESSDISRINARGSFETVLVTFEVMECLRIAEQVHKDTGGAFDITVQKAEPGKPRPVIGMEHVELDMEKVTVRLKRAGVKLDLGGIGKGFGIDKAKVFLEDWEIKDVLISASSTLLGVGAPPGKEGWPVTIGADEPSRRTPIEIVLKNQALSASGLRVRGSHIIDPATGRAARGPSRAWAIAPTGTLADALSTAFMVMTAKSVEAYCKAHPEVSAVLLPRPNSEFVKFGAAFSEI